MSASVLIEAVEAEGFGGGGVVAAAFGDVQVAGVFDGRGDGGADGGQVDGPAAGAAGGGIFPESKVADVVVSLDGPLLADQAGQVRPGGAGAGEAGDGVGGLAGGLAGGGVLAPAGDLDGLAGMREVQAVGMGGLEGAGLEAAVPGVTGRAGDRYLPPGQSFDPGVQQRRGVSRAARCPWAGRFRAAPPRTGRASFPASRLSGGATACQAAGGCWRGSGRRRSGSSVGWPASLPPTLVRPSCCTG